MAGSLKRWLVIEPATNDYGITVLANNRGDEPWTAAVHTQTADGRHVQLTLTREEARRLGEALVAQADRLDRYRTCEGCGMEYDPEDYLVRKYGGYCHRQRAALAAADGREPEAG